MLHQINKERVMIEIEKDIPLPAQKKRNTYPYKAMDIGESFLVNDGKMQIVCNANYRASKAMNMKFIARKEGNGVRVWRIE